MAIVWNKVTWYSKLLAAIFFIFVVPMIAFHIGTAYEQTQLYLKTADSSSQPIDHDSVEPIPANSFNAYSNASSTTNSGVYGEALVGKDPYPGHLIVKNQLGKTVTTTKARDDGRFFLLLAPGTYTISPTSATPMPAFTPTNLIIQDGTIVRLTLQFGQNS